MLERRSVDKDVVIEYIEGQLEQGGALARLLQKHLNLASGGAWTYLPPEITHDVASDLAYGAVTPPVDEKDQIVGENYVAVPVSKPSRPLIVELAVRFLSTHDCAFCVFEDALVRASDPVKSLEIAKYMIYRDEVLYYADREDADPASISHLLSVVESHILIGAFLCVRDGTLIFQARRKLTTDDLEMIAGGTEALLLRAYDGQGYIVWSKSQM